MLRYGRMQSKIFESMLLIKFISGEKMKNKLIIFMLLISGPLFAQLNYGVKAGITSSTQTWEYVYKFASNGNTEARQGINLGIFAEYSDDKYVGVIAEVNYRQKGAKINLDYTGRDTSGTILVPKNLDYKLAYLNITLLGKVRYAALPIVTPYLLAGVKTDYQISNKLDDVDLGFLATDATKQVWGVVIGGGLEFKNLLPVSILAEVRYEFDFNKLYVSDSFQIKTSLLEFKLGIKF